ncbi:hypothetical protein [Serratia marcescens]|uniref:hypothetical protein n=1 Tax=Serratia marcescens TaxID=615 RepID=UPI0021797A90|nr:hypothetical protein [Serratia marcescens]CAI2003032.1 Uncharacterised protein [Serratia marcescens]
MIPLFDKAYSNRVSKELKSKIEEDNKTSGFVARGIIEAIRLLEGDKVAPSTRAMKHKERELIGLLSGYYHIHVAEELLTRTINNISKIKSAPIKNPPPESVIEKSTNEVLMRFIKKNAITYTSTDNESLSESIKNSQFAKKNGIDRVFHEIQEDISIMIRNVFTKPNSNTGDWLIYWKNPQGVNFYLDYTIHVSSTDTTSQQNLKLRLDKIKEKLTN